MRRETARDLPGNSERRQGNRRPNPLPGSTPPPPRLHMHPGRDLRTLARSTTTGTGARRTLTPLCLPGEPQHPPGRPRRCGAWVRLGAPPIGADGVRARTAAWARASARSAALSQHGSPEIGCGQNRQALPWDPLRRRTSRSVRRSPARGGMSTPRNLRTSPPSPGARLARAPFSRNRRFTNPQQKAVGRTRDKFANKKRCSEVHPHMLHRAESAFGEGRPRDTRLAR